ncbi:hypothetical protein BpHYR1_003610 [Brachionus plicatilis]|uniref:Uncharacterized protein n=1 Tax=Brachionus plicatilis TaxID=10195 RepID=A0A3M7PFS6_BRAPC|nr:hypothetical protein BpHYR1_003610 [Brachionus plicatilis]
MFRFNNTIVEELILKELLSSNPHRNLKGLICACFDRSIVQRLKFWTGKITPKYNFGYFKANFFRSFDQSGIVFQIIKKYFKKSAIGSFVSLSFKKINS